MKKVLVFTITCCLLVLAACSGSKKEDVKDALQEVFDSLGVPSETSVSLNLPTSSTVNQEARITWYSGNRGIIQNDGTLIRPDEDTNVTLTAQISLPGESKRFEHVVRCIGWESQVVSTDTYKIPSGFASLVLSDRSKQTLNIYEVSNEVDFILALEDSKYKNNVVIEIKNNLNLGSKNVSKELQAAGKSQSEIDSLLSGSVYRPNQNIPVLHPTLIEEGVGQLIIQGRQNFMIYSKTGVTINHLTTQIKAGGHNASKTNSDSKDIVFRNIHFTGIWEWDELDAGDYKTNDWDYFELGNVDGVWIDHCTFNNAYDGIVDAKGNVKNITLSYLYLDFTVNDFVKTQIDLLEQNINNYPFYKKLRELDSKENIMLVAASQKKGFNLGNTTGGLGFEGLTATLHNILAINLQDRMPRLRRGDVHMYNVVSDSSQLKTIKASMESMKIISQGIVSTEQGAILMENSRFVDINSVIKTHQESNPDQDFTGRFKVVNSEYKNGTTYYLGSSSDNDISNPWYSSNSDTSIKDLEFYFRNYQNIPYNYTLVDAPKLTKHFKDNLVGSGNLDGFNWLDIQASSNLNEHATNKGTKIDANSIVGLDPIYKEINNPIETNTFDVYNYYKDQSGQNRKLVLDKDYTVVVDTSGVNPAQSGEYFITYTLTSKLDPTDIVQVKQIYVVFDENDPNEIFASNITDALDQKVDLIVNTFQPTGTLYILFSDAETLTANQIINDSSVITHVLSSEVTNLTGLEHNGKLNVHLVTVTVVDGETLYSEVVTHSIKLEIIVEITTAEQFALEMVQFDTTGKYYKIMNDIDFTGVFLADLTSEYEFSGVLDGQGFALINITKETTSGGIFTTLRNSIIKDITIKDITILHQDYVLVDSDTQQELRIAVGDGASVFAANAYGNIVFKNITIDNAIIDSLNRTGTTTKGYVSGLVARLRSGKMIIDNISMLNTDVVSKGSNTSLLLAGQENGTIAEISNIYIENSSVTGVAQVAAILARMYDAFISDIVINNVSVIGSSNFGFITGKGEKVTNEVTTTISNVFIYGTLTRVEGSTNNNWGVIVGNNDNETLTTTTNTWAVKITGLPSSAKPIGANSTIDSISDLSQAWWQTNFNSLLSGTWQYDSVSNFIKLI